MSTVEKPVEIRHSPILQNNLTPQAKLHPHLRSRGGIILTFGIQEFPRSRLSLFRLFYLNPVYGIVSWFLETCNLLIFIGNLPFSGKITLIPSLVKPCLYHNSQPTHTNNSPNWPLIGTPKQSHCPWECAHAHLPWVTLEILFGDLGKRFRSKRLWQKGVLLGKWFKNKNILEGNWFQII